MSSAITAAKRHRAILLASTILAFSTSSALAQTVAAVELPPVAVAAPTDQNKTRARPTFDESGATARPVRTTAPSRGAGTGSSDVPSAGTGTGDGSGGSGAAPFNGIVGTSSTVITKEDIAHSPSNTLAEIIGQVSGVQLNSFYGGVNGVGTSVDLRGFGAFAKSNSLVLLNGRRLNDIDMASVDFSTIPLDSIERIEITRGNSGAVLYGDYAVGGVINIVTKTGVGGPPVAIRGEAGVGSFNTRLANISAATNYGPWSTSFFGNGFKSDGYRANNAVDQKNGIGSINYTTPDLKAFFTVTGDDRKLGLPGSRIVDPLNGVDDLATNRRGTSTPFDFSNQQGKSATTGFTKTVMNGVDLIVDGGVRQKDTVGGFFGATLAPSFTSNYVEARLKQWSITPRVSVKNVVLGMPSQILTGIDYYDATYHQDQSSFPGMLPTHRFDLNQKSVAGYWQQTIGILPTTDVSYGGRIQNTHFDARDTFNPLASPFAFGIGGLPLRTDENQYALHAGIEHRVTSEVTLFGRAARAFRTPNVDERVATGPSFDLINFVDIPQTFKLKTQTSHDIEGGFRVKAGGFQNQTSVYLMDLENEIHFDPVNFFNYNLDPTRRYGVETASSLRVNDSLLLRGGGAITRAVFREGQFAGNDIPMVSRYTANAGVTWNIWQNYLVFDATLRAWSSRVMDNDQANNFYRRVPADATVDLKVSGAVDHFFWSFAVNNLFDRLYYDYAVASSFIPLKYAAYPLPGRSFLLKAGVTF
ncbi:Vitamin B12 transporter BtuB [subsurface metagenome]